VTRPRRALLASLATAGAVLAASGAEALSWSRPSCEAFRQSVLDHDAFVRASVVKAWDHRAGEDWSSAEVEARVNETILGRIPRGMTMMFTATATEINGVQFGYIPAEGDEAVLFLDRDRGRRWVVKSAMPAKDYDRDWALRCAF
jgi:hypothetical protein